MNRPPPGARRLLPDRAGSTAQAAQRTDGPAQSAARPRASACTAVDAPTAPAAGRDRRQRPARPPLWLALLALPVAALALSGCASVAPDGLRAELAAPGAQRMGDDAAAALPAPDPAARASAAIARWLTDEPLTQDRAVRIALLNNPGLQARLAALGLADGARVQALTRPDPQSLPGRFASAGEREIERSPGLNLPDPPTLHGRTGPQAGRLQMARLEAAQQALALAADTRRAWLRAVAAGQIAATQQRLYEAAEAGAELAARMARVGNWSRLQLAREQLLLHQADAQSARARLAAALAREQLDQQLGLWGSSAQYRLAQQLPPLPDSALPADGLEQRALRERLDLQAARLGLELEVARLGDARAGAHALVQQRAADLQHSALRARAQLRSAWLAYRTAFDLAQQQRDQVLALQQRITEETTLRYNGMLASVWELLAQARTGAQAVADTLAAQRDFWLAETDLQQALTGSAPDALAGAPAAPGASNPRAQGH